MTALLRRATGPALLVAASVLLSGCSFGGFGGDAPEVEPREPIRTYVALGDGFAAAPYVGTMNRARGCLRSEANYPARVASRLGAQLTDVTCTAATTGSILNATEAPNGKGRLRAQIDAVTPDTDLVTLTVGISDQQMLYRGFFVCMEVPCGQRIPPQDLATEASNAGAAVTTIIRAVLDKAPQATVIVVGYPWIAPHTNPCRTLPQLTQLELDGVNALFFQLNAQLKSAARQTGALFADLSEVSDGHDVCAADPWIRGTKPKDLRSALHPLGPAQKAAADQVIEAAQRR